MKSGISFLLLPAFPSTRYCPEKATETKMTTTGIKLTEATAQLAGEFQGHGLGSDVSIIFTQLDHPGGGPALHRHPYSETFIVRRGTVIFSDGSTTLEAAAGQIVVVPPLTPHRFTGKTDVAEMIDIHASPRFITEWLSEPAGDRRQRELRVGGEAPQGATNSAALPST
jgi:mannose-6-phosphate isomerase-like protein (cupin superfamily)